VDRPPAPDLYRDFSRLDVGTRQRAIYAARQMSTRRILIPVVLLFLALLILGSLAPRNDDPDVVTPPATPLTGAQAPRTVVAEMPARKVVRARPGDMVELSVSSESAGGVEIPELGQVEPVAPGAPAVFTVLPSRPGTYLVRLTDSGEELGRIEVGDPAGGERAPAAGSA
jgi:hypothetical protein